MRVVNLFLPIITPENEQVRQTKIYRLFIKGKANLVRLNKQVDYHKINIQPANHRVKFHSYKMFCCHLIIFNGGFKCDHIQTSVVQISSFSEIIQGSTTFYDIESDRVRAVYWQLARVTLRVLLIYSVVLSLAVELKFYPH